MPQTLIDLVSDKPLICSLGRSCHIDLHISTHYRNTASHMNWLKQLISDQAGIALHIVKQITWHSAVQVAEKNAFTDLVYFGNVSGTKTNYSLIICDCLRTLKVLQDSTKLARNDVFWHKERYRWKVSYQESFSPHDARERVIVAIGTASSLAVWSDASSIDWRPFTIHYLLAESSLYSYQLFGSRFMLLLHWRCGHVF